MSKKDKTSKEVTSFDAQKAQEEKDAKKKLKDAEKAKPGDKGKDNDKKDAKKGGGVKKVRKWLKDFRGEIKKIVWPDFKTVMKNTGIVLITVVIIGALVWIVDFVLTQSIKGLKTLASGMPAASDVTTTSPYADIIDELMGESTTAPADETTAAEATSAEAPTEATTTAAAEQ